MDNSVAVFSPGKTHVDILVYIPAARAGVKNIRGIPMGMAKIK